uniref:Uncharacterized protein n=1 Tax=Podoviridae sp. cttxo15 TaxID=2826584 RepID=A0A8S5N1J3_9CAUD|nr:MAG TPA: hypothetical protein [Podoviridae sp. cttxo15]
MINRSKFSLSNILYLIFFLPYRNNRPSAVWMIRRKVVASFVNIYYFPVVLSTD